MAPLKLPEPVARLIAVLQIKLFAMLFAGYLVGLLYFRRERDIRDMLRVVGAAMVLTLCLGAYRLVQDPSLVRKTIAVVYDTATVTLMALTIFYIVGKWASSYYGASRSALLAIFCAALALLILLSFRRAMWGGIAGAMLVFPMLLSGKPRANVFMLVASSAVLAAAALGTVGQGLVEAAMARVGETSFKDASTLYRFALAMWAVERFADLPLFGWGLKPLWNETIRIRFFLANMENVHSVYVWVLIRFGVMGVFLFGAAVAMIFARIAQVRRAVSEDSHRVLIAVVIVFILLVLFSGIFNPVYSSVRAMLPLGIALGLISRLPEIAAARAPR
jgi:O-antigen ligase